MNGNMSALESVRKPKTEIVETMYPEEYQEQMQPPQMDPMAMQPQDPNMAPNQTMPGEMGVEPMRPGDVFTPGVGWTRRPPVR